MRIIDSFLHPVTRPSESALFSISGESLDADLPEIATRMAASGVERAMLVLFHPEALDHTKAGTSHSFSLSLLADFRREDAFDRLADQARKGVCSITFHPYLQDIVREDWPQALAFAREAERLGLFIAICTAYGSGKIYSIDVLPFAAAVAGSVTCPVVFAHCGGSRILDAMLIADAHPNIWLETSFSLSYWLGSSVEQDMAFAMRKLGAERWMFGSDAPFVEMEKALADHFGFFDRHGFAHSEIEAIMGGNASRLLEG
jgi:predicted TIM-barrel fold metal-dependent hydrolase